MNIIIIIFLIIFLTACEPGQQEKEELAAKKEVLDVLIDPDSAIFGELSQTINNKACLGVNSKNKFGGYTGEKQAMLLRYDTEWWSLLSIDNWSHSYCIELISEVP